MTHIRRYDYPGAPAPKRADDELDAQAKKYSEQQGISYGESVAYVLTNDPALATRYEAERNQPIEVEEPEPRTEQERKYKKIQDAEDDLNHQAEMLMIMHNIGYKDAYKAVLTDPKNADLVKIYTTPR